MLNSGRNITASMLGTNERSLFDPEIVEELQILRLGLSSRSDTVRVGLPEPERSKPTGAAASEADQLFDQLKIDGAAKAWQVGVLDIDIIHRGPIRIVTSEWPPMIMYCKADLTENNIVKQFRLHVLRHARKITLVYGTYRFKQKIAKSWLKDYRCGKLIDAKTSIRETAINLAYSLTAQPYAERNYAIWEELIEEAMTKLRETT